MEFDCQNDCKKHKIKQAMIFKQSRFLKEWRQRWVVLTQNRLYSFEKKQVYKNPTEAMPLQQVQTLKIYHKAQMDRKHVVRLESKAFNFYMSFNNTQDKWSWLSAIERMIARKQGGVQDDKKISEAVRSTFISRESVSATLPPDLRVPSATLPNVQHILENPAADFMKKRRMTLAVHKMQPIKLEIKIEGIKQQTKEPVIEKKEIKPQQPISTPTTQPIHTSPSIVHPPTPQSPTKVSTPQSPTKPLEHKVSGSETTSVSELKKRFQTKNVNQPTYNTPQPVQHIPNIPPQPTHAHTSPHVNSLQTVTVTVPQIVEKEKVVEKVVERIVEKPVYIEKPVEIVVEKVVEKIVYVDKKAESPNSDTGTVDKQGAINRLFDDILISDEDYRRFILFIVDLATAEKLQYGDAIIQCCLFHKNNRFFSQAFLQIFNRQSQDDTLNLLLKFIILIYGKTEEYFYLTDLKVLIDILIREMQMYRSELNHFLILLALKSICTKSSWSKLEGFRVDDLRGLIEEIETTSPSQQNQLTAHEILTYL